MKRLTCLYLLLLYVLPGFCQSVNFTSSNLPVIVINTDGQAIPDDPKITADMGIIFNAGNTRNNITDAFNHYNGKIGIELRGQSSQSFPMKSYGLELRDNSGNSQNKSLFGMSKESDWILYAPYTDKTLMRNFLACTMSAEMGHWASHCRFVELIINGDYQGIYVFMEKIKWGSGRVNVTKMAVTDTSGDALTGGYIFSLDKEAQGWYSAYNSPGTAVKPQFSYVYPKPENIVQSQKDYIKNYVDNFENALYGPQFQDPVNGVRKFADIPSFIDYFIVNEVSRNIDAYRLSSYFYKDLDSKNGKIIAGPVWDYDLAFRNVNYCDGSNTDGWAYDFNSVCPSDTWFVPFWWNNFMKDTAFTASLRCRWKSLRNTSLSETHFNTLIDSIADLTAEARQRHFERWPILGQYVWPNPNPIPATYADEIATLKTWIKTRTEWLDVNLPNSGQCFDYPAELTASVRLSVNPNPVVSNATVVIESRMRQTVSLIVTDAVGRTVVAGSVNLEKGANNVKMNTARWMQGVYFMSLQTTSREKLVKKLVR